MSGNFDRQILVFGYFDLLISIFVSINILFNENIIMIRSIVHRTTFGDGSLFVFVFGVLVRTGDNILVLVNKILND